MQLSRSTSSSNTDLYIHPLKSPTHTVFSPPPLHQHYPPQPERRERMQLSSFTFLRTGAPQISSGMRIIGDSTHQDPCKLSKMQPTVDLINSVVAVLHPKVAEPSKESGTSSSGKSSSSNSKDGGIDAIDQELLMCNVAGFVTIVQIDVEGDNITLLCPCPGALPSKFLLVGSIKWVE
jgi:hypothetical protein